MKTLDEGSLTVENSPQLFEKLLNDVWEENPKTTAKARGKF